MGGGVEECGNAYTVDLGSSLRLTAPIFEKRVYADRVALNVESYACLCMCAGSGLSRLDGPHRRGYRFKSSEKIGRSV